MELLLNNKLIFGRLMEVSEPHLVDRYNRALMAFGFPGTALDSFDVDMIGFSPQIATELGDRDYLDPNRVNRRFIILSPAQESLPVVHTSFSNTASLMHQFFQSNRRAINAVTLRDVLYGEIEEDVARVGDIEDLLSINEVRFKVLSVDRTLAKSEELRELTDRLLTVPGAWRDDAMLNRMVELARQTGDIRQNALVPDKVLFRQEAYWTSHFGGTFVFLDDRTITVISDPSAPGFRRSRPWQVSYLSIHDHGRIFDFLSRTGRIQLPETDWLAASGLAAHRRDMALWALVDDTEPEADLSHVDGLWLDNWMHRHAPEAAGDQRVSFLRTMVRHVEAGLPVEPEAIPDECRFLLVRADPGHPDRWLTNQLLSTFVPFDFVTRFVFDKDGFYAQYEAYGETFRQFVVDTLAKTYLQDKQALRYRLFGLKEN